MNCPDCGSVLVFIHPANPAGPNSRHYRHTCGYCRGVVEIVVTMIRRGIPEEVAQTRNWLFQDRPSSER